MCIYICVHTHTHTHTYISGKGFTLNPIGTLCDWRGPPSEKPCETAAARRSLSIQSCITFGFGSGSPEASSTGIVGVLATICSRKRCV